MLEILIRPEAEEDLEKIFKYTNYSWGLEQAENYQDQLFTAFELISNQDKLGKSYPFSHKPYRKIHVGKHLIFYRLEFDCCIIVRILHESIDIGKHL